MVTVETFCKTDFFVRLLLYLWLLIIHFDLFSSKNWFIGLIIFKKNLFVLCQNLSDLNEVVTSIILMKWLTSSQKSQTNLIKQWFDTISRTISFILFFDYYVWVILSVIWALFNIWFSNEKKTQIYEWKNNLHIQTNCTRFVAVCRYFVFRLDSRMNCGNIGEWIEGKRLDSLCNCISDFVYSKTKFEIWKPLLCNTFLESNMLQYEEPCLEACRC